MTTPTLQRLLSVLPAVACLALLPLSARSGTVPASFVDENAFPGQTFTLPVQLVFLPDGSRLVVEKAGVIRTVTATGLKLPTPFIDLSARVLSNDDRGLLGVAIDPDFASNRWVYMLYTVDPDSNGVDDNIPAFARLERYQASAANPAVADLSTRQILIGGGFADGIPEPPRNMHHMVGTLRFGADKTLMIGSGDGANADIADAGGTDPSFGPGLIAPSQDMGAFRAQSLNSMNGKLLRVDKETGLGLPSNPYWDGNGSSTRSRVWLYGLRNPFRFAFRPGSGSASPELGRPGVLYIGDVGWNQTEEFDIARTGGINFGWPCFEGPYGNAPYQSVTTTAYPDASVLCSAPLSPENPAAGTPPVCWWDHSSGSLSSPAGWVGNCAIGGVFCAGLNYPAANQGLYYLADNGGGWIKALHVDANDHLVSVTDFVTGGGGPVDVEADPTNGDLYYVDINTATVHHVRYAPGEPAPVVNASVTPTSGAAPLTVTLTASASTDPDGDPLSFQWTFGNGSGSHRADTTFTYATAGSYTATVVVTDGHGGTAATQFPITVAPTTTPGRIAQPVTGSLFLQNRSVSLIASPVDTTVTPATYRWDVDLGHNSLFVPSVSVFYGRNAAFTPVAPNDGGQYHFRIRLTVTQGLASISDTVRIYPRVNLTATAIAFSPSSPGPGSSIVVTAKVHSNGDVGSPIVAFQVLEGATLLASGTVAPILQGDSLAVSAPVGVLAFGDHAIRVMVDPGNTLVEVDETDNTAYGTVTVGGLIAAYGMDQGSGTTLADASGHGISGAIAGAAWINPGMYGRALSFNGATSYVDLGNPPLMGTTGSMTWSAWVRPETTPPDDGIILGRSDDPAGWQLKTTPDTGPRTFGIAVLGAPGLHTQRYGNTVVQLHTWYHVAAVYDATARTLDLYVNGALDDGVLVGVVPPSQTDTGLPGTIGCRVGGYYFGGVIDEARIYNRALVQAEIQADMNTPLAGASVGVPGPGTTGPAAAYSFGMGGPNPFRRQATLTYSIPRAGRIRLQVFDVSGHLVSTLEDGLRPAGEHTVTFEPRRLASGLYICRIEASGFTASRKLFLLR